MKNYLKKDNGTTLVSLIFIIIVIMILAVMVFKIGSLNDSKLVVTEKPEVEISNEEENNFNFLNMTESEITSFSKEKYEKYLEIKRYSNNNIAVFPELFVELGLMNEEDIERSNDPKEQLISKVLYSDFEERMLEYMSDSTFSENYSNYKNVDGYVTYTSGAGSIEFYKLYTFDFIKNEDKLYYFDAKIVSEDFYYGDEEKDIKDYLDDYIVVFYSDEEKNIILYDKYIDKEK